MALSTWILTFAIELVCLRAFLDSCLPDKINNFLIAYLCFKITWPALLSVSVEVLPLVKGGMLSFTPFLVRRSLTVNPLP